MQYKRYMKQEEVFELLNAHFASMLKNNTTLLPAERDLSEIVGCSRKTLRAALEKFEREGSLVKGPKGRSLTTRAVDERKSSSRFAFLSCGDGFVNNPAWNKLSSALLRECEKRNVVCDIVLLPWKGVDDALYEELNSKYELLVVANIPDSRRLEEFASRLSSKTLLSVEENYSFAIPDVIAMDNYAAGRIAAERLFEAGYRKPFFICADIRLNDVLYIPYRKRADGFFDACQRLGMDYSRQFEFIRRAPNRYAEVIGFFKLFESLAASDRDSVFIYTDNDIDFHYEALAMEREIPGKFGLVAVNSFSNAVCHNPPVSSVSHGTSKVAEALANAAELFFAKGPAAMKRGCALLEPSFHDGATLRKA